MMKFWLRNLVLSLCVLLVPNIATSAHQNNFEPLSLLPIFITAATIGINGWAISKDVAAYKAADDANSIVSKFKEPDCSLLAILFFIFDPCHSLKNDVEGVDGQAKVEKIGATVSHSLSIASGGLAIAGSIIQSGMAYGGLGGAAFSSILSLIFESVLMFSASSVLSSESLEEAMDPADTHYKYNHTQMLDFHNKLQEAKSASRDALVMSASVVGASLINMVFVHLAFKKAKAAGGV